jgi:hypothetical protein
MKKKRGPKPPRGPARGHPFSRPGLGRGGKHSDKRRVPRTTDKTKRKQEDSK